MLKIFDFFNILQFKNINRNYREISVVQKQKYTKIKLDFDKIILKALREENAK